MKSSLIIRCAMLAMLVSSGVTGGCMGSKPSKFYMLQALSTAGLEPQATIAEKEIAVGVGPVALPDYLDRPQIVTRTGQNELQLAEFDRWVGPLDENFAQVLADNLSTLLATDRVALFPWPKSTPIDYQVAVEVTQFDGAPGGMALLTARWTLRSGDGQNTLAIRKSSISESVGGADYAALAAAQSRAVSRLSREVAAVIQSLRH
jgi:hypothetical protein